MATKKPCNQKVGYFLLQGVEKRHTQMVTVPSTTFTLFCTISICGLPFLNNVAFPLFRLQEMGSLLWCQGVMESGKQTNFLQ